jgi:hypothetical protein
LAAASRCPGHLPTLVLAATIACTGAPTPDKTTDGVDSGTSSPESLPAWLLVVDVSESMLEEGLSLALAVADAAFSEGTPVSVTTADGDGALAGPVVTTDHGPALQQQILCGATCIPAEAAVPSDPTYTCGDPVASLSVEVLDCLCVDGTAACGAATEQGLEAAHQALQQPEVAPADREPRVLVLTDEGDGSSQATDGDPSPGVYETLLQGAVVNVIGPRLDAAGQVACPGVATDWGVARYSAMTELTGGSYEAIQDPSCDTGDIGAAFETILASSGR